MQKNSINHMLDLKIENFGPITTGNIVLKPLTILMGTNNSGKSYAALLIYSIMNNQYHTMHETVEKIFSKIYEKTRDRETDTSIIESFSIKIKIEIYKNLEEELRRNFAELSNIVQINQKTSFLKISSASLQSEITISGNKTSHPVEPTQVIYVKTEDPSSSAEPISINDNIITIHTAAPTLHRMNKIIGNLHKHYHKNIPVVHYLPASRYGVLQSHKILAAQIVKRARYIGLEEFHVPKMPGAITDFLGNLLEMPTREGSCKDIAKHLEENMLHGTIAIRGELPIEINYKYLKQTVPLHRVSSMVSEMAPLVLYLRHVVSDQSLLIIEEPESHLHPDNQIYLAKCIVELVRQGVYVLITTHSPYLVEEIGNYLKASKIPDKDRNKLLKCKNCYIKPNELAAYLFETKDGMSKIKNVKATADNGIDQNQFVEAFETISEHSRTIEEYHEPT